MVYAVSIAFIASFPATARTLRPAAQRPNPSSKRTREKAARRLTPALGEDSVNLFVEHHLAELPQSYWVQYLGSESPEASAVINLLELNSSWGDGEIENFDFTLPGDVTDYMVSVHFDESGNIDEISMES
ncbi:MAG: DUF2004 domain-containing protein [Rhodanobacter sp.]|nr:DUF2004 domain-containing protein [Rhodanobacter sp.]